MSMTGAIVNALAIVAGGAVGLLFRRGIPERVSKTVMIGLGLCVLYIGISGAMECRSILIVIVSMSLGAAVGALLNIDAFRQALIARAERFHRAYPVLRRIGWVALVAQPLVTFAIMVLVHADVDTRVMMLMAMVVGVIVVDTYLIVISYLDTNLAHQLALANLSTEELQKRASGQIGGDSA